MVAAEDRDALGEANLHDKRSGKNKQKWQSCINLERDEERDCLDTVVSTVDVIAHEEVVGGGRLAADL